MFYCFENTMYPFYQNSLKYKLIISIKKKSSSKKISKPNIVIAKYCFRMC